MLKTSTEVYYSCKGSEWHL